MLSRPLPHHHDLSVAGSVAGDGVGTALTEDAFPADQDFLVECTEGLEWREWDQCSAVPAGGIRSRVLYQPRGAAKGRGWFQFMIPNPARWGVATALGLLVLAAGCRPGVEPAASPPARGSLPASGALGLVQQDELSLPEAREEVAVVADDARLFVLGGFDAGGRDTSTVFVFDGQRRQWERGPALPQALDHPAAAVLGGHVYLAGGFRGGAAVRTLYQLTDAGQWVTRAPLAHPRGALGLVGLGGRLYALGGRAQDEVGPAEEYDPATDAWRDLPPLPVPRDHVAAAAYRGLACAAGGRIGSASRNTDRVDCWDAAARRWVLLPALPRTTSGAAAAVLGDRLVVLGGEEPAGIIDLLAVYDGKTWTRPAAMRVPRHGLGAALLDGRLFACAGGTRPGLQAVSACTSIAPAGG